MITYTTLVGGMCNCFCGGGCGGGYGRFVGRGAKGGRHGEAVRAFVGNGVGCEWPSGLWAVKGFVR